MYFKYEKDNSVVIEKPFSRIITPLMMAENVDFSVDFSVHITEWEPGAQVDEHSHSDKLEAMFCISGQGIATIGKEPFDFCPDTMIVATPGEMHCIKNTGTETLRALCIFSPAVTSDFLQDRAKNAINLWNQDNK